MTEAEKLLDLIADRAPRLRASGVVGTVRLAIQDVKVSFDLAPREIAAPSAVEAAPVSANPFEDPETYGLDAVPGFQRPTDEASQDHSRSEDDDQIAAADERRRERRRNR